MQIDQFARAYAGKTDEELLHLASQAHELTFEAEAALKIELARRRVYAEEHFSRRELVSKDLQTGPIHNGKIAAEPTGVAAFVAEALSVYHSQFWLFIKLIVPAVIIGVFTVFIGRSESREIQRHLPRGIEVLAHQMELFESWLVIVGGFFGSWLAFSLAFGASVAVQRIAEGFIPSVSQCYDPVRERVGRFVALSSLLFVLMLVVEGTTIFLESGVMWLCSRQHMHVSDIAIWLMSSGFVSLGVLLLSRFALAIPAVVLDDCKIGQSIFRSDEYTERSWLILAALLGKSIVGGYLAGMLPFWFAQSVLVTVPLPSWFPWVLTAVSIAAVHACTCGNGCLAHRLGHLGG